ncbi:hypothetical protein NDU88_002551 [Pleurodeles waltl]|uniref:Uncharacterized protein n=1 Tax=Pleurodeles waltl TaxID=8319 RepID=A0AAV7Q6Z8_PLEWA|nr:hypothetical protein NDU88_002551 [Pleurodeles waltl]
MCLASVPGGAAHYGDSAAPMWRFCTQEAGSSLGPLPPLLERCPGGGGASVTSLRQCLSSGVRVCCTHYQSWLLAERVGRACGRQGEATGSESAAPSRIQQQAKAARKDNVLHRGATKFALPAHLAILMLPMT